MEKIEKINLIPEINQEIVEASRGKKLVIFIGAGVSRLMGCMGWDSLAKKLVEKCYEFGFINFKEKEILEKDTNQKKVITICHHIMEENAKSEDFFLIMKAALEKSPIETEVHKIYKKIYELRGINITTNADKLLHPEYLKPNIVYKYFNSEKVDDKKLYHIHGMIDDTDSLVFTVDQYIRQYNDKNFMEFIKEIFSNYTILFIGYGMAEFELLDFLITKFDTELDRKQHYNLIGFFSGEENIANFEQHYFKRMNIKVIPFLKDKNGFNQLYYVLDEWSKKINEMTNYISNTYNDIDIFLENGEYMNDTNILQILQEEVYENYFLRQMMGIDIYKKEKILKFLDNNNYFDVEKMPVMQITENETFYAEFYMPIVILRELVEKELISKENICSIINPIIDEILAKTIENFRIHMDLMKILFISNLNIEKYDEYLKFIINSKYNWNSLNYLFVELIPYSLNNKSKLFFIIGNVLTLDEDSGKYKSRYSYSLKKIIENYGKKLAELYSKDLIVLLENQIREIFKENKYKYSWMKIVTIEDSNQNSKYKDEVLIVYFFRDILENLDYSSEENKKYLKNFLEDVEILARVAIYIINKKFFLLKDLFFNQNINFLECDGLKHELYQMIKENQMNMNKLEIDFIEKQINTSIDNLRKEEEQQYLNYMKKEWYSALKEVRKDAYNEIDAVEPENPGYLFYMSSGFKEIEHFSPKNMEYFIENDVESVIGYLKSYIPVKSNEESKQGLGEVLRNAMIAYPNLTNNLVGYSEVDYIYQYYIIEGFIQAIKEKKNINVKEILNLILQIVKEEAIWKSSYIRKQDNYSYELLYSLTWLFESIFEIKKKVFNEDEKEIIELIYQNIFKNLKIENYNGNDKITHYLNSLNGRFYSNFIKYNITNFDKLSDYTKRILESGINNGDTACFYDLGQYYIYLSNIDVNWVEEKIDRLFEENESIFFNIMEGFITYTRNINEIVYKKFNKYYLKYISLSKDTFDEHVDNILISTVCLFYVYMSDNVPINSVIKRSKIDEIREIISFLVGENIRISQGQLENIWKFIIDNFKNSEEKNIVYSELFNFIVKIEEFNESFKNLVNCSIKYLTKENDYQILDNLNYVLNKNKENYKIVGQILYDISCNGIFIDYPEEEVKNIIEILYQNSERDLANSICNKYLEKGYLFLRDLLNIYNVNSK